MTLFWTISAGMMLAALALLAPTLLRQHKAADDDTESQNVAIARERLAELEKAKTSGELSDEEFAQARQDLELALAEDLEGTRTPVPTQRQGGGRMALLSSALLVPLITVPVYLQIGSPQLIEAMPGNHAAMDHTGDGSQMPPITELVEKLRERMEANPENAEGWFLLGRTYMRLEQYANAVYAFEKVVALLPEEPAGLMSLADALSMRDSGQIGPKAIGLLEKALSIDPNSVTALWLLGNSSADKGDTAAALGYWQRAYPLLAGDPQMQANLGQRITGAGGTLPAVTAPPELPPIMAAPAARPTANTTADPGDGPAIRVQVALAPALIERAEPGDTIFVLARAESGPPMPLAVARHRVDDLPLDVTLTDAMAMMPQMKLSSFPRVKISARVSKSGQAGTQPGDLMATDQIVETGNPPDNVQLLIDQLVE